MISVGEGNTRHAKCDPTFDSFCLYENTVPVEP